MANENGLERDIEAINRALSHVAKDTQRYIAELDPLKYLEEINKESDELRKMLALAPVTISIGGNIGVGKSHAGKTISRHGGIPLASESIDSMLVHRYYGDMKTYGPMLQVHFIAERFFRLLHFIERFHNQSRVADRTSEEDPYLFCEALTKIGAMTPEVRDTCQEYFHDKKRQLETEYRKKLTPDLIVLLTQKTTTLGWERLKARGRTMEIDKSGGLTPEFYKALQDEYPIFRKRLDDQKIYGGPVLDLSLDDPKTNNANVSEGVIYIVKSVTDALKTINGYPKLWGYLFFLTILKKSPYEKFTEIVLIVYNSLFILFLASSGFE